MKKIINLKEIADDVEISDGYHTFTELYEHRIELFIALSKAIKAWGHCPSIWKSKKHSDGSEYPGWFVLGIDEELGKQITYHIPIDRWDDCDFAEELEKAEFDGHTSQDVLERLKYL